MECEVSNISHAACVNIVRCKVLSGGKQNKRQTKTQALAVLSKIVRETRRLQYTHIYSLGRVVSLV